MSVDVSVFCGIVWGVKPVCHLVVQGVCTGCWGHALCSFLSFFLHYIGGRFQADKTFKENKENL